MPAGGTSRRGQRTGGRPVIMQRPRRRERRGLRADGRHRRQPQQTPAPPCSPRGPGPRARRELGEYWRIVTSGSCTSQPHHLVANMFA
ncbi:hypothetical protein HBB16_04825 [Pseudonocardia sp. MCCB 268]|nr:hypothetical protein [Pseudonocardia cytotoxica]